jgi:hypothetical protein
MNLTPEQEKEVELRVETARSQGHVQGMADMAAIDGASATDVDTVKRVVIGVIGMLDRVALPAPVGPALAALRTLLAYLP